MVPGVEASAREEKFEDAARTLRFHFDLDRLICRDLQLATDNRPFGSSRLAPADCTALTRVAPRTYTTFHRVSLARSSHLSQVSGVWRTFAVR